MVNHYGVYVNPDEPTTGVYNGNQVNWEYLDYDFICLDCANAIHEFEQMNPDFTDSDWQCFVDDLYCEGHTHLYGEWIQDENGAYMPDKNGEYAFIYDSNYNTIQVVWSKHTIKGSLCSPCYPGQVDVGSSGDFIAYALPPDCVYQD